jgi:hypothetical protein
MDESDQQPPQGEKPLTRDDVLRLIEQHGGPEGLDLSGADLRKADLRELDLHDASLSWADPQGADLYSANLQRVVLYSANLQGANLSHASLQRADLEDAILQGANLSHANLQRANLEDAILQGANLYGANLQRADLADAYWGNLVLGEEIEACFREANSLYRTLKQWYTDAGMYSLAGEFHYREMEARRKLACDLGAFSYAMTMYALRFLYGYGERPLRVIAWAAAVILGLALGHWLFGTLTGGFWSALYYSAVSFTALGYGKWAAEPQGWAGRFLGVGESLLGVFMMALFLVTFTRKMTR